MTSPAADRHATSTPGAAEVSPAQGSDPGGRPPHTDRPAAVEMLHGLENATALDPLTKLGHGLAGALTSSEPVRAALQGDALGHATHPIMVMAPIGTWSSATLLDLIGGEESQEAARRLTLVGVLTAVPSAVTGWAEYANAGPKGRRVAVVHALANAAAVGVQVTSFAARSAGAHRAGAALSLGAMALTGAAGYLGGHLAAARHVTSHDPSFGPEGQDAVNYAR